MKHIGTQTLDTERLRLRKLTIIDVEDYNNIRFDDGQIVCEPPFSDEQIALVQKRIKGYNSLSFYWWGIEEKMHNRIVGEIFTVSNNERMLSCEIAYCTAIKYRNNGYMTEALRRVLLFLLLDVGYNRIQAGHLADNQASGRVMEKAGMVFEGILRQDNRNRDGILTDSKIYSMLRQDVLNK